MTVEEKEKALADIVSVQTNLAELSGETGHFGPIYGGDQILSSVITALEHGATVEDLRPLLQSRHERIKQASQLYNQKLQDDARWLSATFGSRI